MFITVKTSYINIRDLYSGWLETGEASVARISRELALSITLGSSNPQFIPPLADCPK